MDGTSNLSALARPEFYRFHQGEKVLPFADAEYEARLAGVRAIMAEKGIDACVLTSMPCPLLKRITLRTSQPITA